MKQCKVLSYNPHRHVIVFKYDNVDIQAYFETTDMPEYVYVEEKNGMYEILLKKPAMKSKVKADKKVKKEEVKNSEE